MNAHANVIKLPQPPLAVALQCAERGWPVFPCSPANKAPLVPGGFKSATTDQDRVREMWGAHPQAMVGIPTGKATGMWVLDVDTKHGDGHAELDALIEADGNEFWRTMTVRTPSGGVHYLWCMVEGVRNRGSVAPNIDVRGEGGYVIAAGSVNEDGEYYEWYDQLDPVMAPQWLLDLVLSKTHEPKPAPAPVPGLGPNRRYVDAAAADELAKLVRTTSGRNNALNDASFALGQFVGAGAMERHNAEHRLFSAANANGYVGKDGDREAWATIRSGLDSGEREPRQIPEASTPRRDEIPEKYRKAADQFIAAIEREAEQQPGSAIVNNNHELAHDTGASAWVGPPNVPLQPSEEHLGADLPQPPGSTADEAEGMIPTPIRLSEWEGRTIPTREWLVVGVIPSRTVTLLSGDGGVGKSLFALQLGIATAIGEQVAGLAPTRGRCFYLGAEDEADEFHRRADDIVRHYGCTFADLHNFLLLPMAGHDALLAAPGRDGLIQPTAVYDRLVEICSGFDPKLVVLDTSADLFGGDEIKRVQVRKFIGLLRAFAQEQDCAVVLLSHPSVSGMQSGSGLSGSTAWNNSVRSRLYMEPAMDEGKPTDAIILSTKKANYGPRDFEVVFRWEDGVFVPDLGVGPEEQSKSEEAADNKFMELLTLIVAQDQHLSPKPSSTYAPVMFWKHPDADGFSKRAFEKAMQRLLKAKKIKIVEEGPPSKRRQRLVPAGEAEAA